jgi:hypothetical protein
LNQDLVDRTHGRWPWVAAGAAVPSTLVLAACRRRLGEDVRWAFWAPLPIYFWHPTEEWVWPGGLLFPITRTLGLVINAGLGWGLACVAALRGLRSPAPGAAGILAIARHPRGGARAAGLGAALGLGSGGVMLSALGRRLRRRRG